jgi:hypothetical protein
MIAVFSGNSNAQFLMSDVSDGRLSPFGSERDSRFESVKNGTHVL